MVIRGPVPKPPGEKVRRHQDTFTPNRIIKDDGKLRGLRLPKDVPWCERTVKWWEAWRRSPQAQLMSATDWDAMLEAAVVHNAIWTDPTLLKPSELTSMTKELHRILSSYGLTYADRLKLRIRIEDESDSRSDKEYGEVPSNVLPMYKRMLGAA